MCKTGFSYESLADAELAELTKNGDNCAYNELAVRYMAVIGAIARKYSVSTYERTDLVQEGLLGLLYACKTYSADRGASFGGYLRIIVERRYVSILRRLRARKAIPESAIVDLDELENSSEQYADSPEELVLLKERVAAAISSLKAVLTAMEFEVIMMYSDGISYRDIAKRLDVNEKSVDNALQRARKKVSRLDAGKE